MEFENQYLNYSEYIELGGTLPEMPFNILEFEAKKKIDERTQNRLKDIKEIPQEIKICMYAIINKIKSYNDTNNKSMAYSSESIDGYSVSYANVSRETIKTKDAEINDIIRTYLTGVIVNKEHILYLGGGSVC